MYSIHVEMSNSLKNFLTHYPKLFEEAKTTGINKTLDLLQDTSLKKAPYKTGTLRREIKQIYNERKLVAGTDSSFKYAYIQDEGGTIKAVNGPYLKFMTSDGSWHSVKQVTIKPKHYFFRNLEDQRSRVLNEFTKSFQDMMAKV